MTLDNQIASASEMEEIGNEYLQAKNDLIVYVNSLPWDNQLRTFLESYVILNDQIFDGFKSMISDKLFS